MGNHVSQARGSQTRGRQTVAKNVGFPPTDAIGPVMPWETDRNPQAQACEPVCRLPGPANAGRSCYAGTCFSLSGLRIVRSAWIRPSEMSGTRIFVGRPSSKIATPIWPFTSHRRISAEAEIPLRDVPRT